MCLSRGFSTLLFCPLCRGYTHDPHTTAPLEARRRLGPLWEPGGVLLDVETTHTVPGTGPFLWLFAPYFLASEQFSPSAVGHPLAGFPQPNFQRRIRLIFSTLTFFMMSGNGKKGRGQDDSLKATQLDPTYYKGFARYLHPLGLYL